MVKKILLILLLIIPFNVFADSSHSSIVMDMDSGRILYKKNINDRRLIASTTKIMTCIVVLENESLDKKVTVGDEVLEMYGTNIYLQVGEVLTIKDLLYGLMLRSGNDAAIVLAKNVFSSYDVFIESMNEKAKSLGMNNTHFSNPHGLDESSENISSAYDMAILAKYAYKNSVYRKIVSTKKYITKSNLKSYEWYNRVKLLSDYRYCVGGKNGYTPKAGKTLVSYANKDGLKLLIVTLDDSDPYINHKKLYRNIYSKYKNYIIVDKNNFNIDKNFLKQEFYLKKSFKYPLKSDELNNISVHVNISNDYENSYVIVNHNAKEIGKLRLYLNNKKRKKKMSFFK